MEKNLNLVEYKRKKCEGVSYKYNKIVREYEKEIKEREQLLVDYEAIMRKKRGIQYRKYVQKIHVQQQIIEIKKQKLLEYLCDRDQHLKRSRNGEN